MAEPSAAARIGAFDWLRGLAVLFMVQCHALSLLKAEHQTEGLYRWLVRLDGLVAPAFIFSAGFSLALVQVRAAMAKGDRGPRIRRSLRRLFEVLGVATLVNAIWFPIFEAPHRLWRLDILHCIGLSLLLALPLLIGLGRRPLVLRWVTLAMALAVFFAAPLFERGAAPFDWLLNKTTDSQFPLLPWAGYVYLGASAGATAAHGSLRALLRWLLGLLGLGAALWALQRPLAGLYPPHDFWVTNPANAAQRWTQVLVVVLVLFACEQRISRFATALPVRFLATFGASSMAAYFFHEMALFKPLPLIGFSFHRVWGGKVDWAQYWLLTAALIGWTFVCVLAADFLYKKVDQRLSGRRARAPAPSGGAKQPALG